MKILALDLGTTTGYAMDDNGKRSLAGSWPLATSKEVTAWGKTRLTRRQDPRPMRLFSKMTQLSEDTALPDIIVFEDVEFSTYTLQTQLWAALRTAVWFWAHFRDIRHIDCVGVTTLKKFATGHGGATKDMMLSALKKRWPGRETGCDDNAVDAIFLLEWARTNLSRMKI